MASNADGNNNTTSSSDDITVTVLLFASAREAADGTSRLDMTLSSADATTTTLRAKLADKYPDLAALVLDEDSVTFALNEEYILEERSLKTGDTVALIPPISGG